MERPIVLTPLGRCCHRDQGGRAGPSLSLPQSGGGLIPVNHATMQPVGSVGNSTPPDAAAILADRVYEAEHSNALAKAQTTAFSDSLSKNRRCVCRGGMHVAWESYYQFSVELSKGNARLAASGELYIMQKLKYTHRQETWSGSDKGYVQTILEAFRVYEDGLTLLDAHWGNAPYSQVCGLRTKEESDLYLTRLSLRSPMPTVKGGDYLSSYPPAIVPLHYLTEREDEDGLHTESEWKEDLDKFLLIPSKGSPTSYDFEYHPDHCKDIHVGGLLPEVSRIGNPVRPLEMTFPVRRSGTSTLPTNNTERTLASSAGREQSPHRPTFSSPSELHGS